MNNFGGRKGWHFTVNSIQNIIRIYFKKLHSFELENLDELVDSKVHATYEINETNIFIIYSINIIEAVINLPNKKDRTDLPQNSTRHPKKRSHQYN